VVSKQHVHDDRDDDAADGDEENDDVTRSLTHYIPRAELSMGWVDPWVGLGWVHCSKSTKNLLAFWVGAQDILNISLNSLLLNDIMTPFFICVTTVKNMRKNASLTKSTT